MKVGDRAKVYNRLNSGKVVEEGLVTIKKVIQEGIASGDSWLCKVQFDGEKEQYQRWIMPNDIIKQ